MESLHQLAELARSYVDPAKIQITPALLNCHLSNQSGVCIFLFLVNYRKIAGYLINAYSFGWVVIKLTRYTYVNSIPQERWKGTKLWISHYTYTTRIIIKTAQSHIKIGLEDFGDAPGPHFEVKTCDQFRLKNIIRLTFTRQALPLSVVLVRCRRLQNLLDKQASFLGSLIH